MDYVRTPDERFDNLPDYPFEPHYVVVEGLRVHYLDEGPPAGPVVLMLHDEPSWSYLYRKMIPPLAAAGLRCVVPDLVGFGRSDKPAKRADYSYAGHVEWMRSALFDSLDLSGITMFGQDWGGLIGLRLVAEHPERFSRLVVANTGLPTGDGRMSEAFANWQRFSQEVPELPVGAIVAGGCVVRPSDEVIAAYDAPFPDESFKEGARIFPTLVPTRPDDPASEANRRAWKVLERFEHPVLAAFSDSDPITKGGDRIFHEKVPGTKGQAHRVIEGAGHFLQEDKGEELAAVVAAFVAATPEEGQ
ncbi:MAG TPA: haloalkane dehalogenase [Acidimicrobiales bacterium]|nr:haloalkane dehalogenase [Acidimicrobiales bacterium]